MCSRGAQLRRHVLSTACARRCATPFGVDIVGITELIALVGALVGGIVARQRKQEAERLNEQLRKINMQLRQQARAGTMYAPGLSYAPAGGGAGAAVVPQGIVAGADMGAAAAAATATVVAPARVAPSMDDDMTPEQVQTREVMREGKRLLRSGQGALWQAALPAKMIRRPPADVSPCAQPNVWECMVHDLALLS